MVREEAEREPQRSGAASEEEQPEVELLGEDEVAAAGNGNEEEAGATGIGEEEEGKLPKGRWLPSTIFAKDLRQLEEDRVLLPQADGGSLPPTTFHPTPQPGNGWSSRRTSSAASACAIEVLAGRPS